MKTTTTSIWNCLSTKNTYMEIWKAWLPRHISYLTSSVQFWIRENSFGSNFGVILSFLASVLVSVFPLSLPGDTHETMLCGPSITHLFPGLSCIPRWQEAHSPPWCRSAGRTDTCSQVPNHGRSIWWYWGCWCRPSAPALPQCHWLDGNMIENS